jgi:hypothetical protein
MVLGNSQFTTPLVFRPLSDTLFKRRDRALSTAYSRTLTRSNAGLYKALEPFSDQALEEVTRRTLHQVATTGKQLTFEGQAITRHADSDSESDVSAPLGKHRLAPGFRIRSSMASPVVGTESGAGTGETGTRAGCSSPP